MYRRIFIFVFVLIIIGISGYALAERYSFDNIYASVDIPDSYTVILPNNIDSHQSLLKDIGYNADKLAKKFTENGILLQAWSSDLSSCIEITALQTDRSKLIFDVDKQSAQTRGSYRVSYFPNNLYDNYKYKSSDWKNFGDNIGRFLVLKYEHFTNEIKDHTGFARKSIKNGYEISVDYKALNRRATFDDEKILNKIFKSWSFMQTNALSEVADAGISITKIPSEETKNRSIKIEGVAKQGVEFIAVVMSIGSTKPYIVKAVANEKDKFSIPITFPKQGVFLITLTASRDGKELGEWAYPVTFKEGLLSVKFLEDTPSNVYDNVYKIKGIAEPGAKIQVMLNNKTISNRSVAGNGSFVVPINTKQEGNYEVVLVFSKRNLETRRFKFSFTRTVSDEEKLIRISKKAVNATYGNLTRANEKFKGQIIRFNCYLANMINIDNYYLLKLAYTKNDTKMQNFVYLKSDKPLPEQRIGRRVKGFGELLGFCNETITNTDGISIENLPLIELISYE